MKISAPRGTRDILPEETAQWQWMEAIARETASRYGFHEIRFPVFEHTELFLRGIGNTTDVVQKEMYTFEDKGGRSITLRPEGTASVARALIEHGLHLRPMPLKTYYIAPNFRYEHTQKGRLRQHHQFGVECFGTAEPTADAEIIALADAYMKALGLRGISLRLNSIGCEHCRRTYHEKLRRHLHDVQGELCDDCQERMERNPMRVMDCKNEKCRVLSEKAPHVVDSLCPECEIHFQRVIQELEFLDIPFSLDPRLVRGLDYYTRTVFEFVTAPEDGALAVCGGGRYDGLVEALGASPLPALGFGSGLERLLMVLRGQESAFPETGRLDLYVAAMGEAAARYAARLCRTLRAQGMRVERDLCARGLKSQMKHADKLGARYTVVIGDDELQNDRIELREMATGSVHTGILDASFLKSVISHK